MSSDYTILSSRIIRGTEAGKVARLVHRTNKSGNRSALRCCGWLGVLGNGSYHKASGLGIQPQVVFPTPSELNALLNSLQ